MSAAQHTSGLSYGQIVRNAGGTWQGDTITFTPDALVRFACMVNRGEESRQIEAWTWFDERGDFHLSHDFFAQAREKYAATRNRITLLNDARALLRQASAQVGLSQAEVLGVLETLNASADLRQFSEREHDLFLDLIAELEPEEQPEADSYRSLGPATLDTPIERVGGL